jgi:DnaK suppressor protein
VNKTLAKSAATPAKKVPAKPAVAPTPAKPAPKPAARGVSHAATLPDPAPAPPANRFTDRFAPARAPVRGHDEVPDVVKTLTKPDPKLANAWKTKAARDLTEAELLAMPDSEYMNEKQREFFRLRLQAQKDDLLSNAGETTEHLREDTSIVPDPADRATIEEEHALELRTRDRERKLLKKIGQSLARVESGDYGYCDETGEPIGLARLLARPTATLSLEAQQRREMKQKMFGD